MSDEITITAKDAPITPMQHVGKIANGHAAAATFADYRSRRAENTLSAQRADLQSFAEYLSGVDVPASAEALQAGPDAWRGVTWGLVEGFVKWMLKKGFAISTVNRKLSTVKVYCKLASKAGTVDPGELALIRAVSGYGRTEAKRIDKRRPVTRFHKTQKSAPVAISDDAAAELVDQPHTPQGLRDEIMLRLLLDYGLRVGELAELRLSDVDLDRRVMTVYRPKVDKTARFQLGRTPATFGALQQWINECCVSGQEYLLRGSRRGGGLTDNRMSERAIKARVHELGKVNGLPGLSPHDCRHYCATKLATTSTLDALMDFFSWSSPSTALRYIAAGQYADEKVKR